MAEQVRRWSLEYPDMRSDVRLCSTARRKFEAPHPPMYFFFETRQLLT
jgi:hypothetical protein